MFKGEQELFRTELRVAIGARLEMHDCKQGMNRLSRISVLLLYNVLDFMEGIFHRNTSRFHSPKNHAKLESVLCKKKNRGGSISRSIESILSLPV